MNHSLVYWHKSLIFCANEISWASTLIKKMKIQKHLSYWQSLIQSDVKNESYKYNINRSQTKGAINLLHVAISIWLHGEEEARKNCDCTGQELLLCVHATNTVSFIIYNHS